MTLKKTNKPSLHKTFNGAISFDIYRISINFTIKKIKDTTNATINVFIKEEEEEDDDEKIAYIPFSFFVYK